MQAGLVSTGVKRVACAKSPIHKALSWAVKADHMTEEVAPLIDATRFSAMAGSLPDESLRDILENFWTSFRTLAQDFANQAAAGDIDGMSRTAHAIKGAAANIGAMRLSAVAAGFERDCRNDSEPPAAAAAQKLAELVEATRQKVEADLSSLRAKAD